LFLKKIKLKKIKKKYFSNFLKIIFKSEEFISSFSISFANLIWRLLVINYCGKILAGIYFAGFAVGSLPGSLFNNTFGPSIIKNKISINNNWLLFFKFILILLLFSSFIIFINFDIFSNGSITQLFCSIISILGSYFMIKGLFKRQQAIQKRKRNKNIFKIDIVYSIFIVLIIPLLYNLGGEEIVLYAFLFSSLTSFLTYNYLANKIFNL
tara:strand:+ start:117 stop:746 length:630 start_codon:yes stop_codon:yes gene_type:complete